MTRLIFILVLLLIGQAFFIISKENIDFQNERGKLGELYYNWFERVYEQGFEITGKIIHADWFSYNTTLPNS